MTKLTKEQQKQKQQILDELTEARTKVEDALSELDTIREKAKDFVSDIYGEMESYFDDKSEKWQEGDNGQQYDTWKTSWDEVASALDESVPSLEDCVQAIEAFEDLAVDPQSC